MEEFMRCHLVVIVLLKVSFILLVMVLVNVNKDIFVHLLQLHLKCIDVVCFVKYFDWIVVVVELFK